MNPWDRLAHFLVTRRRWIILAGLMLAMTAALSLPKVDFSTDILELLPGTLPTARAFRHFDTNFIQTDDFAVVLEVAEPAAPSDMDNVMPAFVAALQGVQDVADVRSGMPDFTDSKVLRPLLDKFPLFLDEQELLMLVQKLQPDAVAPRIARDRQRLLASPGPFIAERILQDPLGLLEVVLVHFRKFSCNRPSAPASGGQGGEGFSSLDGRLRLLQVTVRGNSRDSNYCQRMAGQIRAAMERTRASLPAKLAGQLRISLTGRCAFAADISRQLRSNIISSGTLSLLLVMLVFWIGFRRLWPLVAVTVTLCLAVLSCLALGAAWFGRLNIITTSFAAIMIGLGVDYGILLYNQQSRALCSDAVSALAESFRVHGSGIILSAITTGVAFASIWLTRSAALSQFGLIAALGISLCALWMLIFFSSLCAAGSGRPQSPRAAGRLMRLGEVIVKHPKAILATAGALAAAALLVLLIGSPRGVAFDSNPESVRFRNIEADETLRRVLAKTGEHKQTLVVLQHGGTWSQLCDGSRELSRRLDGLLASGEVKRYDSATPILASDAKQRANLQALSKLDFAGIRQAFTAALLANGFEPQQFTGFLDWLDAVRRQTADPSSAVMAHTEFLNRLPEWGSLAARFLNPKQGMSATYVYPAQPLTSEADLFRWRSLLGVDETQREMTGWSALVTEMQPQMRRDFFKLVAVTLTLVLVCLAVTYRSVSLVGMTLLPLVLAVVFLLATMKLTGISLNVANFFALPLVLGCGINYGIYMVNAWRHGQSDVPTLVGTTGRALVMNALTACFGFGSLVLSNHTGLMSLGIVVGVGILWVLACSLIVLPAALAWRQGAGS